MGLGPYHRKRDFRRTAEPPGRKRTRAAKRSKALAFVIQKHDASRLHYDFRLELGGVLLSWAVPKGPSLDPTQKRLAVQVEDHPVEYGKFEGTIPKGQYGGGTVLVWDRGTWEPRDDPAQALRKGALHFRVSGEKLNGEFSLVRMHTRDGDERNWLLVKSKDEFARRQAEYDVTSERPESVASGRDLAGISAGKPARRTRRPGSSALRMQAKPATDGARAVPLPSFVAPELATLVESAPEGDGWLHETKLDGYRALCRIQRGRVQWLTRKGLDWSTRFAALTPAARALKVDEALLDGEVVVLRSDGTSDFQALQNSLSTGSKARLVFVAFDLLHLDGRDLRSRPQLERKQLLKLLLGRRRSALRYSEHVQGGGVAMHARACGDGLEGIVSKRLTAPYRSGRQTDWLKIKCGQRQEFVVGGWTDPRGSRTGFGALLLGYHDEHGALRFGGKLGTGFDGGRRMQILKRLRRARASPFTPAPTGALARGVHWAKPALVVEVEFAGWTADGMLRHASFQGLREDKPAREVKRERARRTPELERRGGPASSNGRAPPSTLSERRASAPEPSKGRARASNVSQSPGRTDGTELAGVRITHPDRVLVTDPDITKLELASYYASIAERILPHVARRPISFVRCPSGAEGGCFFQRHPTAGFPDAVKRVHDSKRAPPYAWIDSVQGLVGLAQMGVLELHPWGARIDDLERPDRIVLDLDPAPDVPWKRVLDTARVVHDLLKELALESWPKVTGGKGLHVVVPLARGHTWDEIKSFSQGVALTLERTAPDLYLSKASKGARKGKIFIDWLRNSRSATAVAPYSTRARPGAPIALPFSWKDLQDIPSSDTFRLADLATWLRRLKRDPWAGFFTARQKITPRARRSVGLK